MARMNDADKVKKKFNVFDENVSFDAVRHVKKSYSADDDGDEDDEEINWDGTPSIKYTRNQQDGSANASKPPMPDLSTLAIPFASSASRPSSNASSASAQQKNESSFGSAVHAASFGHNRSRSMTFAWRQPEAFTLNVVEETGVGEDEKEKIKPIMTHPFKSSNASMNSNFSLEYVYDDEVYSPKKQMSAEDIEKMQQEIQSLRRTVLSARRDRWMKLPVDETLHRIMKGESYSLEMYKSLEDKLELLDKAVKRHDGNAITAAVLFLQRTVSRQIFTRELLKRAVAADHYLNYLKFHFDFAEYINTLGMLGRTEEAAIFKYKLALSSSDVTVKLSKLKESLRSNFQADSHLSSEASLVKEYTDLLERQRPIDDSDANTEASGRSQLFKDFPRKRSLVDLSVITTLYYCCLYHFDLSENSLASPIAIKKRHQISERQYLWTSIGARAKLKQWRDIEGLLTTKGWFGGTKMKAVIGFDKIVGILHRNNAPPDILDKYLSLMDDPEARLALAMKVSCHKTVVDTMVALKDRPALETYASNLDRYSKEGLYAHDVLNTSSIKWR